MLLCHRALKIGNERNLTLNDVPDVQMTVDPPKELVLELVSSANTAEILFQTLIKCLVYGFSAFKRPREHWKRVYVNFP